MFLKRVCSHIFSTVSTVNVNTFRAINFALGKSDTELINKWKQRFADEKIPEIEPSIRNILEHVIKKEMIIDEKDKSKELKVKLSKSQCEHFERLCECRMARMPVQYIIGEWDFCEMVLKMTPPVFIPRPETEELVELILQQCDDTIGMRFMEIGCGSGAISLALLNALPKAQGISIDQSEMACNLTLENAKNLDLDDRLKIIKHKLTDNSQIPEVAEKLDLIVSNPPYVLTKDVKSLEPEISLYEDLRAIDGGPDGLDIIKVILRFAADNLQPQGHLWLEIDPTQPKLIEAYIAEQNDALNMKFVSSYKDMFGKERFVEIMKC